jgi:hypothetical protein
LLLLSFYLTFGFASILPSYLLLASCAQLASYLCLLIYVTLSISCLLRISNEGEIEGEKASTRQPKVMLMLAYEYKQA